MPKKKTNKPDTADQPTAVADVPVLPPVQLPENDTSPSADRKRKAITLIHSATLREWYAVLIAELATVAELFVRGGSLVTVDPVTAAMTPANKTRLAELITDVCEVWEQKGQKLNPVSIPRPAVLQGILERRVYPGVRELREVLPHPVILPDGTVLTEPGYRAMPPKSVTLSDGTVLTEPGYGLYLPPHGLDLQVKDQPTRADAERALRVLLDLVSDFPFATPSHRAAWIAMLLTAVTSAAHGGNVPATVITADRPGTGKGKLSQLISYILIGKLTGTTTWSTGTEQRKGISTAVREGARLVIYDNVTSEICGDALDIVLTSRQWRDRILGSMRSVDMHHSLQIMITANHAQVASDTTRRVLGVRLRALGESPELRAGWKHPDIEGYTREHRAELLSAALTIVRAYVVAGRPPVKMTPLGSYETWSEWVCAPLIWLGLPDPIKTQEEFARGASSDAGKHEAIITAWLAAIGEEPITTAELRDAMRLKAGDGKHRTLRDAMKHADIDIDNAVKVGLGLRRMIGRKTKDGWTLAPVGRTRENAQQWAVRRAKDGE